MENIERYIEENIANIKPFKNGSDELVLVDITTKEVIEKGNIKEMLSRSYVQDVINNSLNEKTETVEEPVQEETVEATEEVDVNSVIDNVIEEDKQEMEEAINPAETVEEQDDLENIPFDDEDVYDEHEIVEEYSVPEDKKNNLKKKALEVITVITVVSALGILGYKACGKELPNPDLKSAVSTVVETTEEKENNQDDTNDEPEIPENDEPEIEEEKVEEPIVPERTLDELYSDSRYTEITEENLTQATNDLVNEFAKHGIEINGQDALYFTALNNITHIAQTNPDLLSQLFGEVDKETVISKAGHVIGQIVTLEVTAKDEQVDWTVALIDDADKKIAAHDMKLIEDCKVIARNEELTNEEKAEQIQGLVQDKFVKPNYDKTVGRDFEDGTHSALTTEDGADFTTDAIFTGVMMGDNELKDYIYKSETMDDLMAISANEDNVSNLFTIIEDCKGKSF